MKPAGGLAWVQGTPTSRTAGLLPGAAICSSSLADSSGRRLVCSATQKQARTRRTGPRGVKVSTKYRRPGSAKGSAVHPQGHASTLCASGVMPSRSAGCACSVAKARSPTPATCTRLEQQPRGHRGSSHLLDGRKAARSLVFSGTCQGTRAHASRVPLRPALFSHLCPVEGALDKTVNSGPVKRAAMRREGSAAGGRSGDRLEKKVEPGWSRHLKDTETLVQLRCPWRQTAVCTTKEFHTAHLTASSQLAPEQCVNKACLQWKGGCGHHLRWPDGNCMCPAVTDSRPTSAWDLKSQPVSCSAATSPCWGCLRLRKTLDHRGARQLTWPEAEDGMAQDVHRGGGVAQATLPTLLTRCGV